MPRNVNFTILCCYFFPNKSKVLHFRQFSNAKFLLPPMRKSIKTKGRQRDDQVLFFSEDVRTGSTRPFIYILNRMTFSCRQTVTVCAAYPIKIYVGLKSGRKRHSFVFDRLSVWRASVGGREREYFPWRRCCHTVWN